MHFWAERLNCAELTIKINTRGFVFNQSILIWRKKKTKKIQNFANLKKGKTKIKRNEGHRFPAGCVWWVLFFIIKMRFSFLEEVVGGGVIKGIWNEVFNQFCRVFRVFFFFGRWNYCWLMRSYKIDCMKSIVSSCFFLFVMRPRKKDLWTRFTLWNKRRKKVKINEIKRMFSQWTKPIDSFNLKIFFNLTRHD